MKTLMASLLRTSADLRNFEWRPIGSRSLADSVPQVAAVINRRAGYHPAPRPELIFDRDFICVIDDQYVDWYVFRFYQFQSQLFFEGGEEAWSALAWVAGSGDRAGAIRLRGSGGY